MRELSIALVGPGAIAETHASAIRAVDGLSLRSIVGGTAADVRARFGASVDQYDTVAAMLAFGRPDIVAIATPSGEHFAAARAALLAGCHVLAEKPLCVDPVEAAQLTALAAERQRVAGTVSQRRYEPVHQHLARHLRSGALGQIRLIEADVHWWRPDAYYADKPWRGEIAQGGGSLFNQGIHSLDLMLFLAGPVAMVTAISATVGHAIAVEDLTGAVLSFDSGAMGVLVTSTATPPGTPAGLRLFTDKGWCSIEQEKVVAWSFADVEPPQHGSGAASGASDPGAIGIAGHVAQWSDFRDAVREGRAPAITFGDGCDAVRVVSAIYRSAQERRHVLVSEFPRMIAP